MAWDSYGLDTNSYTLDTYSLDSCGWDTYCLDTLATYGLDSCSWDIYGLDTYVGLQSTIHTMCCVANVLCSTEWQI